MTVPDLIRLMTNKLATLNGQKTTATIHGDVEMVVALEVQITETQNTLDQLKTL
jgi:hypothetical protein